MASEQVLAARRVQALEEQARQMAEINRKLDLLIAKLGITEGSDPAASQPDDKPAGKKK